MMRFRFLEPRKDVASAEQVRALRERREGQGWTVEQLADEVHASPLELSAWEAGVVRVPSGQALRIHWMGDVDAWHAAREAATALACPWVRENVPDLYERMFGDPAGSWYADSALTRQHLAGCATCQDAWTRAREAVGFPLEPDTSSEGVRARYDRWVARLPRWLRPLFSFAALLTELSAVAFFVLNMPTRGAGFRAHVYGAGFGLFAGLAALTAGSVLVVRVTRRPVGALVPGLAAGVGGLLGWAMLDTGVHLGDPGPWAGAMAVGFAISLVGFRAAKAQNAREAQALAAGLPPRPLLSSPELSAAIQRGDPAAVFMMAGEWRAHYAQPPAGSEPESSALDRGTS
jgi:hypothetical protein